MTGTPTSWHPPSPLPRLSPRAIITSLEVSTKQEALAALAERAAELCRLSPDILYAALLEREQLGTTGIGSGIAIPHGRLPGLPTPCMVLARLSRPIAFEAIDQQPVDLLFLLLSPEHDGSTHLRMLSHISRLLHDGDLRRRLRTCRTALTLCELLNHGAAA